jgi:hypothetical protein
MAMKPKGGAEPTMRQIKHFWRLLDEGLITSANLQTYLENLDQTMPIFSTVVDNTMGLKPLIRKAVKAAKTGDVNIDSDITAERFEVEYKVRPVTLGIARFQEGESGRDCATRLMSEGFVLENICELAAFLDTFPANVAKYDEVVALGAKSRWRSERHGWLVPSAAVNRRGARSFFLTRFDDPYSSDVGVLVSRL